jgi:hypothetical protein
LESKLYKAHFLLKSIVETIASSRIMKARRPAALQQFWPAGEFCQEM